MKKMLIMLWTYCAVLLCGTVFAATLQTEKNHDIVEYSKDAEIIVGIPVFGREESENWKLIRGDKKAMEFLSQPNVKIYPVRKYAKIGGSQLPEKAFAKISAIMNIANFIGEPKEKIFAVIDELNKGPGTTSKIGKIMKENGWMSPRDMLYANCSPDEADKRWEKASKLWEKIAVGYERAIDDAREEKGLLMFPEYLEPFRLWILCDGEPAPYMIYDYKNKDAQ